MTNHGLVRAAGYLRKTSVGNLGAQRCLVASDICLKPAMGAEAPDSIWYRTDIAMQRIRVSATRFSRPHMGARNNVLCLHGIRRMWLCATRYSSE